MRPLVPHAQCRLWIAASLAAAAGDTRACGQGQPQLQRPFQLPGGGPPVVIRPDRLGAIDRGSDEEAEDMAAPVGRAPVNPNDEILRLALDRERLVYKMQFDGWCRSRFGDHDQLERGLHRRLKSRIAECRRELQLSDAQVRKLELAGRGDIKRLLDRLCAIERTLDDPGATASALSAALSEMAVLEPALNNGPFGNDSLFSKMLLSKLTSEQRSLRQRALAERRSMRYQVAIDRGVTAIRENLGLNAQQAQALEVLLRQSTRAPKQYGQAPDSALVLFQLSQLPEDKVRPIFDVDQWRAASHWMSAYTGSPRSRNVLERHGFVFETDSQNGAPAPAGTERPGRKPRG